VKNLGRLGAGLVEKLQRNSDVASAILPPTGGGHEEYADAAIKFFADRYGSLDAFKHSLASDPVGVAGDLSTLLSGGETAVARIGPVAKTAR